MNRVWPRIKLALSVISKACFSICMVYILLFIFMGKLGLFGEQFRPIGHLSGAAYDGRQIYLCTFSPAKLIAFDNNLNEVLRIPLLKSPMKMEAVDGRLVFDHAGTAYYPTEPVPTSQYFLSVRYDADILSRTSILHPVSGKWVLLEPTWISILQSWPAVPLCLCLVLAGLICEYFAGTSLIRRTGVLRWALDSRKEAAAAEDRDGPE